MAFNSIAFIVFFPVFLAIYWMLSGRSRIAATLIASYLFYGYWDFRFLGLILLSTLVDYCVGLALGRSSDTWMRRALLALSVCVNLGILACFKYFNFFAHSLESVFAEAGMSLDWATLNVVLPVGISFYTFQTLSYTIDVFRKEFEPEKDLLRFATFVAFFPQLVAGPIVRAQSLLPQLRQDAKYTTSLLSDGFGRVAVGFFKKLVIADSLAVVVDPLFEFPDGYGSLNALMLICLFSIQVYADFSGYSDIAIGCAKMLGISLPENFRAPFFSTSFREFWRRWHITLSEWLRDYLYIPLGGSSQTLTTTIRNIVITMILGGLWHGANWTFVLWGFVHGVLIAFEHVVLSRFGTGEESRLHFLRRLVGSAGGVVWVFGMFSLTAILFRSQDLSQAALICERILSFEGWSPNALHNRIPLLKGIGLASLFMGLEFVFLHKLTQKLVLQSSWTRSVAYACILWAIALFGTYEGTAFVYFQF